MAVKCAGRFGSLLPVPIIVLTARNSDIDKVSLLDLGADDYVTKPFSPAELLARIRVALRRTTPDDETMSGQVQAGEFTIDYDRRRVQRGSQDIRLTPKEFQLLSLFVQQRRSSADASRDPETDLGRQRRRSTRAPVGAHLAASQED